MMKKPGGIKTAGVVIAAALLVVCLLLAAFLSTTRSGTRDSITLPESLPSTSPDTGETVEGELFLQVDSGNIRQVLDAMDRPEAYHQVLTVTSFWDTSSTRSTVEIWQDGNLIRAQVSNTQSTKNLLTDGTSLWIWYNNDQSARLLKLDGTVTLDDLMGIPTYETLVALSPDEIAEASFVMLDETDGLNCLYLRVLHGTEEDRYWVDANTQLLCRADSLSEEVQTYQVRQSACEVLTSGDATFESIFTLPDGTVLSPTAE